MKKLLSLLLTLGLTCAPCGMALAASAQPAPAPAAAAKPAPAKPGCSGRQTGTGCLAEGGSRLSWQSFQQGLSQFFLPLLQEQGSQQSLRFPG